MSTCISTAQASVKCLSRCSLPKVYFYWRGVSFFGAMHVFHGRREPLGPSMTILREFHSALRESFYENLCQGLVELVRSSWEDPDEILSEVLARSYTGPCEQMLWISF